MTENSKALTAVLDKFAQAPPCSCKNWEEYKEKYMEIVGADVFSAFDYLASLAISETQKEMIAKLKIEWQNKANPCMKCGSVECSMCYLDFESWLKQEYGVKE
jgi:hypothetical protein